MEGLVKAIYGGELGMIIKGIDGVKHSLERSKGGGIIVDGVVEEKHKVVDGVGKG